MALSANRNLKGKVEGRTRELIITSGTLIYVGALVNVLLSTGKAVVGADTANHFFAGVAIRGGTGVADGSVTCIVECHGTRFLPHNGTAAQTDVGKMFCVVGDDKVDLITAVTNEVIVGRCVGVDTANNLVEIDLSDRSIGAQLDAISATGSIVSSSPANAGGLGYSTGAGLAATQATSKSTTVTNGDPSNCGTITMNAASLAAGTIVSFTFTNAAIGANDVLILNHVSGGTMGSYTLNSRCAAGSAIIDLRNNTAGALAEAVVIAWARVRGVIA